MRLAYLIVLAAAQAAANVPDLTASMAFLSAPTRSHSAWTSSQARAITSIYPYRGRLYVSAGDWYANTGAAPIFSIDPDTGEFVNEYTAGTETINYFRTASDGRLYVPGLDQREGHENQAPLFRREMDGSWTALRTIPFGNIETLTSPANEGFAMHTWDLACWHGKVFTAGYGIAVGPEGSNSEMANATPLLVNAQRRYDLGGGWTGFAYRRFSAFLAFDDEIFCYPSQYFCADNPGRSSFELEEWLYNPSTGLFDCQTNTWENLLPGGAAAATASGRGYSATYNGYYTMLWHATPFKGRVLYLAGTENTCTTPWALYSSVNENHHVKAVKIDLNEGEVPFCITRYQTRHGDEKLAVVAARPDASDGSIVNTVWETDDGIGFTPLFTFKANQQASALARHGDAWYVGMGWRNTCPTNWSFSGEDTVGNIYRIQWTKPYHPVSLAPATAAVKGNGALARLAVKVAWVDSPPASLALVFNGGTVATWENVAEGETYIFDVSTEPGRVYDFHFTATSGDGSVYTSAGSFLAGAVDGWFAVDFADAGYKTGRDWTDISLVSNPGGTWSDVAGTAEIVDATAFAPRHLAINGDEEVSYTPSSPSNAADDVVVTGRVAVVASPLEDAALDEDMIASLVFAETDGRIVPYGLADGQWHALDCPENLIAGDWVDFAVELDLNSSAAPRIQYRIGGTGEDKYLALAASPECVRSISFRGAGGVECFLGSTRSKTIAGFPVPEIGDGTGDGGLGFSTDQATGSRTFSVTVANPVAGAWYTAFTTEDLAKPFKAECVVQASAGGETIPLGVDATPDRKFVKIVVSQTPFAIGQELDQ